MCGESVEGAVGTRGTDLPDELREAGLEAREDAEDVEGGVAVAVLQRRQQQLRQQAHMRPAEARWPCRRRRRCCGCHPRRRHSMQPSTARPRIAVSRGQARQSQQNTTKPRDGETVATRAEQLRTAARAEEDAAH